jgi:ERCC4-related helicase
MMQSAFENGQSVRDPATNRVGTVVEARHPQYRVSFDGEKKWYRDTDIEAVSEQRAKPVRKDEFLRDLLLAKIQYRLTDSLYAYRASRTQFEAYQFRPALKFLSNPDQRILIADEVGLGKTIEAAIIYMELKARANVQRVMVLCPSRLTQKWQDELESRFGERFEVYNRDQIRDWLRKEKERRADTLRAIVPYESIRADKLIFEIGDTSPRLDLLIVDEAHYMRNPNTKTHQVGELLCNNSDAVVFLTATPLHLGNDDLYELLHLLSPGDYYDRGTFKEQIAPNAMINQAARYIKAKRTEEALEALKEAGDYPQICVNPLYQDVLAQLNHVLSETGEDEPPTSLDDEARIRMFRHVQDLNTISRVFTRTKKREVLHAAKRAAHTIHVDLSETEWAFYNAALEHEYSEASYQSSYQYRVPIGFIMATKERKLASCLPATYEEYRSEGRETVFSSLEIDDITVPIRMELSQGSDSVLKAGNVMRRKGKDSKLDHLLDFLRKTFEESEDSKILIFSTYKNTIAYLAKRLQSAGYPCHHIDGDVPIKERYRRIEEFRTRHEKRIMISSEVGAEGLDFQFCDVLVNYDLPWNPMQVEQRIGRLDRMGQKSERIRIVNFVINGTIESNIFERLYSRIQIFENAVGDLEAILGESIKELSEVVYAKKLSPEEQQKLADEKADVIVRRRQEQEDFEKKRDELMGQDIFFQDEEINYTVRSGRVIHPEEVVALVRTYLKKAHPKTSLKKDSEDDTWFLQADPSLVVALQRYAATPNFSDNLRHLMSESRDGLPCTFNSDYARERPLLEFITIQHPLAQMAVEYWRDEAKKAPYYPWATLSIEGHPEEAGLGYFFIYALDEEGLSPKRTLRSIVVLDDGRFASKTAEFLLGQFHNAQLLDVDDSDRDDMSHRWAQVEQEITFSRVITLRDQIREESKRRNEAILEQRRQAVKSSYHAKIESAEKRLRESTDSNIRRMYEGRVRNLGAELSEKLGTLNKATYSISHHLVAGGRIEIRPSVTFVEAQADKSLDDVDSVSENTFVEALVDEATGSLKDSPIRILEVELESTMQQEREVRVKYRPRPKNIWQKFVARLFKKQ